MLVLSLELKTKLRMLLLSNVYIICAATSSPGKDDSPSGERVKVAMKSCLWQFLEI